MIAQHERRRQADVVKEFASIWLKRLYSARRRVSKS